MKTTDKTPNTAKARVEIELEDLELKANKLNDFMGKEAFNSLSLTQRILLGQQYQAMRMYASILNTRLRHWEDDDEK